MRRYVTLALTVVALLLVAAPAARAVLPTNELGCSGRATLRAARGFRPATATGTHQDEGPITLPRKASIRWEGSGGAKGRTYKGQIAVAVGWFPVIGEVEVPIYSWGRGPQGVTSDRGTETTPEGFEKIPAGTYKVTGFHRDEAGACEGYVYIRFTGRSRGNPVPVEQAGLAAAALGAFGLAYSAKRKRIVPIDAQGNEKKRDCSDIERELAELKETHKLLQDMVPDEQAKHDRAKRDHGERSAVLRNAPAEALGKLPGETDAQARARKQKELDDQLSEAKEQFEQFQRKIKEYEDAIRRAEEELRKCREEAGR